jgi:outer membrane protein TolC
MQRLLLGLAVVTACGCALPARDVARHVCRNIIMPEQRTIDYRDPAPLPPARIPDSLPPRTVSDPRPDTPEWRLSLDDAIRIALENARVVRVLAGTTATASGQTIYDAAITNTTIDQAQAAFDPALRWNSLWSRTNIPGGVLDLIDPTRADIRGTPTDAYRSDLALTKTNVLGGQWALTWIDNPTRIAAPGPFPLNPQNPHSVEVSYTQPLLQGAGFRVNTAPIVIARLNTEQSYFQYKDAVQELVRGVVEGYWNLVQARIVVWARKIQVEQAQLAYDLADARFKTGVEGDRGTVDQALVSLDQFRASLIAAEADVLAREAALRNLLFLPPDDGRRIVPVSAPTTLRLKPEWEALIRLAEQRRPDIVELKLVTEADQERLIQAQSQALPRLDAVGTYRWNGLSGEAPNGERVSTKPGEFTDWSVGVNFSVPLGRRQGRAQVRQQRLLIERDRADVEEQVHTAVHQLAGTIRDLDSAYDQYRVFKATREAADRNVTTQRFLFKSGLKKNFTYLNVLQAITDWGNAVTSEAQQLLNYNVGLAVLERQTGTILETHGLVFAEERFRAAGPLCDVCRGRDYPAALVPTGAPQRYPGTGEPGENAFDLRNPAERKPAPEQLKPPQPALPGEGK